MIRQLGGRTHHNLFTRAFCFYFITTSPYCLFSYDIQNSCFWHPVHHDIKMFIKCSRVCNRWSPPKLQWYKLMCKNSTCNNHVVEGCWHSGQNQIPQHCFYFIRSRPYHFLHILVGNHIQIQLRLWYPTSHNIWNIHNMSIGTYVYAWD